ncbi:MAG: pilin [Patescibacteria group bacterium]
MLARITFRAWTALTAAAALLLPSAGSAQEGIEPPCIPGLPCEGGTKDDLFAAIVKIIVFILDFVALIAIVFIIIAGIRLIVSQGEDEAKDKAKKSIIYVIVGLIVILLARLIVGFITGTVPGIFGT